MPDRVFYLGMSVKVLERTVSGYLLEKSSGETFFSQRYDRSLPPGYPVMVYGVMEVWELRSYYPGMERDQTYVISWPDFNPWNLEESIGLAL